ncbi:MAG TPA: hypothetical protein DIW64_12050 [Cellvibrio sp.]|nr:hypothetical protein [Cellvibrio sp.]
MATQTLNTHEKMVLSTADRQLVVNALAQIISTNAGGWLSPSHPAKDGIERKHKPLGSNALNAADLAAYLALAGPNHCMDGWSYLSRGLNAYLLGDPHSAWHFAYYAELRAAQSILSASGCGVFNTWNAIIDTNGDIQLVDRGRVLPTHSMVWLALRDVLQFSSGGLASLSGATEVFGHSLADLLTYAFPGQTATQTAARWISDWTFDIGTGIEDKQFRNRCSYGPHHLTPHVAPIGQVVVFMEDFWQSLQPTPGASFLDLDKYLLRRAMITQANEKIQRVQGNNKTPAPLQVIAELNAAYSRMCSAAPTVGYIPQAFFAQATPIEPLIFSAARNKNPAPQDPQPVLARATLLLRMATGVTRRLLMDSGYTKGTELDFWFADLAVEHGFVNSFQEIEDDRSALYSDCALAMGDMVSAFHGATAPVNRAKLFNEPSVKPHAICEVNRIAHWSLQP